MSQAKVYLTLNALGTASAKRIAENARIDRGEVYRQLESLEKKGLVARVLGIPNEYKSMALDQALQILINQKNKENLELQQKANALLKKDTQITTHKEEEFEFSIIPANDYRIQHMTKVHDWIQKEILWHTQIERVPVAITIYSEAMKKASTRGVRWRAIAELTSTPTDRALEFIKTYRKENPNFDIRFSTSISLVTFSLCDEKELIFSTTEVKGAAGSQTLCTTNPQLIRVTKDFFEFKWNAAIKEYQKDRHQQELKNAL